MEDMYRLDFSRGTVEKIDSRIPQRSREEAADTRQEATPRVRTGYILMTQGLGPRMKPEKDDEA